MPADLVALVADLIPAPADSGYVEDWPEDEREFYREGDWTSFTDRAEKLARLRQEKAARAILAALGMEAKPRTEGTETNPSVLHAERRHPGWEYATTEGPRKAWYGQSTPPDGDDWERNVDAGIFGWERFDYHEESYWRRPEE